VLLQGNLKEFNLPNIFQLVKMSAKTGALTIKREEEWGRIFFRNGQIYYAFTVPQALPIGERLVKAGKITTAQLKAALTEQKASDESARLGTILLEQGVIDRKTLETAVRAQIEDAAFDFFGWTEGEFSFSADEVNDEDILVEMNVENVIMEGCRRIDEWELIFDALGSLERVAHLTYDERVDEHGEVRFTPDEWRVCCHIDGRRDINTVLRDCGLDRFTAAKLIYGLHSNGLVSVSEPMIEGIGKGRSIAIRGPIDIYNEVFLNTLTDSNVIKHLRVEMIDEKEVEIPIYAASLPPLNGNGDEETLVFTASTASPDAAWKHLAKESSAFVLLANANSDDSLRSTQRDLAFVRELGELPVVVATYVSMADEAVSPKVVRKVLGLKADVPVVQCSLRDRDSVMAVISTAIDLAGD
jgi:hypothetical protein